MKLFFYHVLGLSEVKLNLIFIAYHIFYLKINV